MNTLKQTFQEMVRYPSATLGLAIIAILIIVAIYALITIPYDEAIRLWRGGEEIWGDYPKNAAPVWSDLFSPTKRAQTIVVKSQDAVASKTLKTVSEGTTDIEILLPFDYPYDGFPQEISVYFTSKYTTKQPYASLTWLTPDGREVRVSDFALQPTQTYRASQDSRLKRRLGDRQPEIGLFANPNLETPTVIKGRYTLKIDAIVFEANADVDAKLVMYGEVHGLAGTDHYRRDLMVALLWGTPLALAFGLLAALGTTLTTMVIAGIGSWFGGIIDGLIQRITEVNMILPILPILIMVGTFYSRSIWLMLGIVVLLSIFGSAIKTYRAIFLQVRESPYIEAARSYGASDTRIILLYMIPRIIPMLVPQLVTLVPSFVFLEATLAVLGLGDPVLPTWGKIINDAQANGALHHGLYYWILEPAILLMLTGLGFAMVGFALDRIFNPKLRGL